MSPMIPDEASEARGFETFVVRLMRAPSGEIRGLVHHVRTGEKLTFDGLPALGEALVHLARQGEEAGS